MFADRPTRTRRGWIALAITMTLLAGCVSDAPAAEDAPDVVTPPAETADAGSDGGGTEDTVTPGEAPAPPEPVETTLYFTPDGGLATTLPDPGFVVLKGSYSGLVANFQVNEFVTPALATPALMHATDLTVRMWVESDVPVARSDVFDFALWFGSTRSMPVLGFTAFQEPVLQPGTPTLVEFTATPGEMRSLVATGGDSWRAFTLSGMLHENSGIIRMLTGGEHASHVVVTLQDLPEDPLTAAGTAAEEQFTGALANFSPDACDAMEGVTTATHPIVLGANTTFLEVGLVPKSNPPHHVDMDLALHDGTTLLMKTFGPSGTEGLFLAGPTAEDLAGKELTLKVTACVAAHTEYVVTVRHD